MAEQSLEIKDFSGGMTDNFISCPPNKFEQADNMLIRPDAKPEFRPGSEIIDEDDYQIPYVSSMKRVDSAVKFEGRKFYQTMGKLYYSATGWQEVQGPGATSMFSTSVAQSNQNSYAEWNNHLLVANDYRVRPVFVYIDSSTVKMRTIGLPKVTTAEVGSIGFSAGVGASRNYVFVRAHTYSIDGVEFTQRSAVSDVKNYTGAITNSITGLPVLTNGTNQHYETTTIKLEIYRTIDAGTVYYKAGEVTNGTTTFSDTTNDTNLQLNELLYLEQDDLDYDQPPECKFVLQCQGVAYYLNIKDSRGDIFPNRIVQANPDQIFAAPESNTVDVDGDLTGGGIVGQYPIVFTDSRTYRLQGFYDSTGNGGVQAIEIARTVGCVSHKSVIQTPEGLFFAAKDGFYFTDGYQVLRVSEDLPVTYPQLTVTAAQGKRIYGAYDPFKKFLYWAASSTSDKAENDRIFVGHLFYGVKRDMPFTRWSGGYWEDNFQPTALLFDEDTNVLIRGDKRGYLLKHTPGLVNDVKIYTDKTPDAWTLLPIIFDYRGPAIDFGSATVRKWATKLIVYADSIGRVTIMPYSNNDNTGVFNEMTEIKSNSPVLWEDPVLWGDSTVRWNYLPIVNAVRRFPQRSIRCSYKQIRLTNSFTVVEDSDSMGTATFDGAANTVTLDTAGVTWDPNAVDYKISSSFDDYSTEYTITERTDTVLTVEDTTDILPTGSFSFKVKGYRKNDAIRLLSYAIIHQMMTPSQSPYRGDG